MNKNQQLDKRLNFVIRATQQNLFKDVYAANAYYCSLSKAKRETTTNDKLLEEISK